VHNRPSRYGKVTHAWLDRLVLHQQPLAPPLPLLQAGGRCSAQQLQLRLYYVCHAAQTHKHTSVRQATEGPVGQNFEAVFGMVQPRRRRLGNGVGD
jgi:hypothetical protein